MTPCQSHPHSVDKDKISTSSIVMRAIDATTFSELQAFTKDLESRPIDRLLRDITELVKPSESKAQIVSYVIATKFRRSDPEERRKVMENLESTIATLDAGDQRDRVNFVIERSKAKAGGSGLPHSEEKKILASAIVL